MNRPSRDLVLQALYRLNQQLNVDAHIPASDPDPIEKLIAVYGWEETRDSIMGILIDNSCQEWWHVAINALYPSISDGKPLENVNYFIALLYACLKQTSQFDTDDSIWNTVWTMVIKLKQISYNSHYEPLNDPEIKLIVEEIIECRS